MLDIMQLIDKRNKFNYNGEKFLDYASGNEIGLCFCKDNGSVYKMSLDRNYLITNNVKPQDKDEWVDLVLKGGDDEFLITTACGVRILLNNGFFIKGIYELGNIEFAQLYLIQLSKTKLKALNIGIYKGLGDIYSEYTLLDIIAHQNEDIAKNKHILTNKDNFSDEIITKAENDIKQAITTKLVMESDLANYDYQIYIKAIETFVNYQLENDIDYCINPKTMEITTIVFDDDEECSIFYPRYYSQSAFKIRELLKDEKFVKISSVARFLTIIPPSYILNGRIVDDYRQIVENTCVENHKPDNSKLYLEPIQKGDIIITETKNRMYPYSVHLITDDVGLVYILISDKITNSTPSQNICAVIRPQSVCPEYLYLYLASEIGQMILDLEFVGGVEDEISILLPKNDDDYYKDMFRARVLNEKSYNELAQTPKEQALTQIVLDAKNRGEFKVEFIDELVAKGESLGDILDAEFRAECIIVRNRNKIFKESIENDINELVACFEKGAYKAVFALAGSILEAFVTDWLGEIHGKDYFKEAYRVPGMGRNADFEAYIDAIKEIKKPEWDKEAEKAHFIRKKRNLIHASKLYKELKKGDEISEKVCKEVIEYLKDIIKTREI